MSEIEGRKRPKYLRQDAAGVGASASEGDSAPSVTLTRGELRCLMREAVAGAQPTGASLVIDRQGMARLLGVSAAHLDALRKRGLPALMVGQAVRFEPARVIEWLRQQPAEGEQHATHG